MKEKIVRIIKKREITTTLVDVACGVVEDADHWDDAVGGAVGAADVAAAAADAVDGEADAASGF